MFEFIRAEEWSSWNILRGREQAIKFWEPLHYTDCRCHLFSWQVVASSIEHSIANSIIKHYFYNYVCGLNGRWQLIEIAQVIWHIDCGLINVILCMHTLSPVYFTKSEERWYQIKGNCTPFGPNHLERPERDYKQRFNDHSCLAYIVVSVLFSVILNLVINSLFRIV